jgi:dolichol-phosphate mannosyltransferase
MKKELSIIFPTLNEAENLKYLIPEFEAMLKSLNISKYELKVIDDGSDDGTHQLIKRLSEQNDRIHLTIRLGDPSLPMAIWDGINTAVYENVMWLDADGSMHTDAAKLLIEKFFTTGSVIIGSRFKDGGGYKGVKNLNDQSIIKAIKNVNDSEDSVIGMLTSIFFNKFLTLIFDSSIKDITSGFIIGDKSNFTKNLFEKYGYGEYFIVLVAHLQKKGIKVEEVAYICDTRKYGKSKTAPTLYKLILRGVPYITTAIKSRKDLRK